MARRLDAVAAFSVSQSPQPRSIRSARCFSRNPAGLWRLGSSWRRKPFFSIAGRGRAPVMRHISPCTEGQRRSSALPPTLELARRRRTPRRSRDSSIPSSAPQNRRFAPPCRPHLVQTLRPHATMGTDPPPRRRNDNLLDLPTRPRCWSERRKAAWSSKLN